MNVKKKVGFCCEGVAAGLMAAVAIEVFPHNPIWFLSALASIFTVLSGSFMVK